MRFWRMVTAAIAAVVTIPTASTAHASTPGATGVRATTGHRAYFKMHSVGFDASVRIRRSVVWPAVMMSTVILALSLVTSPASAIPIPNVDGNGHLRLDSSGKCLLSQGSAEDAVAVQYSCLDFADQKWYFIEAFAAGFYNIYNANTNKCLTALCNHNVVVETCHTGTAGYNQVWEVLPTGSDTDPSPWIMLRNFGLGYIPGDYYYPPFSNYSTERGYCLVAQGGSNNTQAIVWNCHPEFADQLWMFPV
jgi:hypothetical protein